MAQPEDLGKKRWSWYVTVVLSALYAALVAPVMSSLGWFAVWLYPAIYLVMVIGSVHEFSGAEFFVLLTLLNFSFCLVVIRFLYWVNEGLPQ